MLFLWIAASAARICPSADLPAGPALDQRREQDLVDIALGAVLDLVQQHLHRLDGHALFGLLDGGQIDPGQGRGGDVVKAQVAGLHLESVEAKMAV